MTNVQQFSPHIYYPVSELSLVKDVTVLKNTKIKTIGYVHMKDRPIIKESTYAEECVNLDMRHVEKDILEIYPYLIFGVLCTINGEPVITVKFMKKLDLSSVDLDNFKEQCILLRSRVKYFDDIVALAKTYNWN